MGGYITFAIISKLTSNLLPADAPDYFGAAFVLLTLTSERVCRRHKAMLRDGVH
jgi:hypothetical protein